MQKQRDPVKVLFQKIFDNKASSEEKEQIARWLSRLDISEEEPSFDEVEKQRLILQEKFHNHYTNRKKKIFHLPVWVTAVAAAILIIVTVGLLFLTGTPETKETSYYGYFTKVRERKIVTLPDGTRIMLNNSSSMKFPKVFSDSLREVFLDGEAFFDVAHNSKKPFVVHTGKLNIRVLGTSFNITNYTSDEEVGVVVVTGKVGVHIKDQKQQWVLTAGKQLIYHPTTGKTFQNTVDVIDYLAWQKGELLFRNRRLEDICKTLERWYGVTITIRNSPLKGKKITLEQQHESLQTVMKMLAIAGGFNYKIKDNHVQIIQGGDSM